MKFFQVRLLLLNKKNIFVAWAMLFFISVHAQDTVEFALRDSSGVYTPISLKEEIKLSQFSNVFVKLISKNPQKYVEMTLARGTAPVNVRGFLVKSIEYQPLTEHYSDWKDIFHPGDKLLVTISHRTNGIKFSRD